MCGITFIVNKHGEKISRDLITRANEALYHRGPDDQSSFFWHNTAFGFTRLSIVDLAGGNQPFFSEDKKVILFCNGEIYNYKQLREQLIAKGHSFRSRSDCEVIVHAYEEDPLGFVSELDGMFAFVLLDMNRNLAVMARDRLGIKPLFLFNDPDYFVCSSEIKGLFATGVVPSTLDHQGIADFFVFNYIPGVGTAFNGVRHLEPATLFTYNTETSQSSSRRYWEPFFPEAQPNKWPKIRLYSQQLNKQLSDSVSSHTIGDVPIASYLSGGIDSTITSILLQRIQEHDSKLKTFSISFADKNLDESGVFLKTVKKYNFDNEVFHCSSLNTSTFAEAIFAIEQPQTSPMDVPLFNLSKLVRDNRIKVALSGEGSDELFGGYLQFTLNQIRRILHIPAVQPIKEIFLSKILQYYLGDPKDRELYYRLYTEDQTQVIDQFGTFPAWYPAWVAKQELSKNIFERPVTNSLSEGSAIHTIAQDLKGKYKDIDDLDKSIYLEQKTRLPNYLLSRADRNSMAHSVELRVPYLSNQMIDFAATVPPILKMLGVREKFILRRAFSKIIPRHVSKRRKFGYSAPNAYLWKDKDPERDELMSVSSIKKSGVFSFAQVSQLRKELNETQDARRKADIMSLLTGVLSVQILADRYIK